MRGLLYSAVLVVLAASTVTLTARGEADIEPADLFRSACSALDEGKPSEAIGELEALADRGVSDPVVSFDRGLAYAARVRAGAEQSGDLGRAAHGFEEAKELSRDASLAEDASRALAAVRAEVARRRARAGEPVDIAMGDSLGRSIVKLLPENAWAALSAISAAVLCVAMLVRARRTEKRAKVAAMTTLGIAAGLLAIGSALALSARDARLHLREGIVVSPSARLLDDRHVAMSGVAPLAEGSRVRILHEGAGFSRVAAAGGEGFVASSAILPIAKR